MQGKFPISCHLHVEEAFERLFLNPNSIRTLGPLERELILFGAFTVFGNEDDVNEQGKKSIDTGAKPEALMEIVLTAALSRGPRALRMAIPFLKSLPAVSMRVDESNIASPCEYFTAEFGQLPQWVSELNAFSAASLRDYAILRRQILSDGAASRKTKELLTMLLNAVTANASGIKSHALAAKRQGATKEEIYDVLLIGISIGGIVTWINGINSISDEL